MELPISCPVCGNQTVHIKGCAQGLSEDGLSVDVYYDCENDHKFTHTFFSENGGHWVKVEAEK